LESNQNLVGSISEVDFFGKYKSRYDGDSSSTKITKYRHVHPISGNFLEKAKFFLKYRRATMIYGIFRTKFLQKSFPEYKYMTNEAVLILNLLKHGDFHVVDEVLMHRNADGISSVGRIHSLRAVHVSRLGILFMGLPLIEWSLKNLGLKFVVKNFSAFAGIFYVLYGRIMLDIMRSLKHHLTKDKN